MLKEYLSNLANAFRSKLGITDKINAQNFADKVEDVFDAGYQKGKSEGGGDSSFWDEFQDYGNRNHYVYTFAYQYWTDKIYNPKYTINAHNYGLQNTFNNSSITDTKVDIIVNGQLAGSFTNSKIRTIRRLILNNVTTINNPFGNCTALSDITVEGEWLKSINFGVCPLTTESIVSNIEALSEAVTGQTLTLKKTAVESMVFPHTSAQSGITYSSFSELEQTKPNWTISLS